MNIQSNLNLLEVCPCASISATGVPGEMHNSDNDNRIRSDNEKDAIWKAMDQSTAQLSIYCRKAKRLGLNSGNGGGDLLHERGSEPLLLLLVPVKPEAISDSASERMMSRKLNSF